MRNFTFKSTTREAKLRQARDWFGKNYIVNNIDDAMRIAPMGSETGAYVGHGDRLLGASLRVAQLRTRVSRTRRPPPEMILGWSGLDQGPSSSLWFQIVGVEAHSFLPYDQYDRGKCAGPLMNQRPLEDLILESRDPRALRERFGLPHPLSKFASNGAVRECAYADAILELANDWTCEMPESARHTAAMWFLFESELACFRACAES